MTEQDKLNELLDVLHCYSAEEEVPIIAREAMADAYARLSDTTTFVREEDRVNHWHCEKCGFVEGGPALFHKYCPECGRKVKR